MYRFVVVLQVNGPVTGGTYRGEEGLYADVLFCLQGNGPVTQWGRFSVGGGGS